MERTVSFYFGYIAAEVHTDFFAPTISETMEGIVSTSETHMARLLFKIAVEMAKLGQMLDSINDMDDGTLRRLHIPKHRQFLCKFRQDIRG